MTPGGTGAGAVMTTDPLPRWQMAQTVAFPVFVIVCVLADNGALHGAGVWGEATPAPWQKALFRQEGALPLPVKLVPWQAWQKENPARLPGAALAPAPRAAGGGR